MSNPHQVTVNFERALSEYTGAPYVVAVNSCTMAILLAMKWHLLEHHKDVMQHWINYDNSVSIPRRTYVSVPMSVTHAGGRPTFRDEEWIGEYQLQPWPVWDSARRFTSGMYRHGQMQCVSFHASKILGLEQGGAILHDSPEADWWLRRARFDGRKQGVAPKDDNFTMIGWHCYLNPSTAAQGLLKLHSLPRHNADLPNDPYPDLSTMEIFR